MTVRHWMLVLAAMVGGSFVGPMSTHGAEMPKDKPPLAVAGFHEILLVSVDDSRLVGRLIGMSERIESVRFSPDGQRIAATGGLPGRLGEVQV